MSLILPRPVGIGVYLRGPSMYATTTPERYARALGARWVAPVSKAYSDAALLTLRDAGFKVWLFEQPSEWSTPAKAEETLARLTIRVQALGLSGVVVDTEHAQNWYAAGLDAAMAFCARMKRSRVPIVWTTVPRWTYWRQFAAELKGQRHITASPQIYGVRDVSTLTTPALRAAELEMWRAAWGAGQVAPSLAAWGRDAASQAAYFAEWADEPTVALWNTGSGVPAETMGAQLAAAGVGQGSEAIAVAQSLLNPKGAGVAALACVGVVALGGVAVKK